MTTPSTRPDSRVQLTDPEHGIVGPGARRRKRDQMDERQLQQLLDETARDLGVVGASMAVLDADGVRELATGTANLATGQAVTPDTLFQIGSTTKLFNAALVLTLVDEGRLALDEPIAMYVPGIDLPDGAASRITLRHLLSMSSGLDNGSYQDYGPGPESVERYVRALADVPLVAGAGALFGYSNAGSTLAGFVAETVGGGTWDQLLRERVLQPAGLERTETLLDRLILRPVAVGHALDADGNASTLPYWSLPRSLAPAGSTLCSTAGDLVRFASKAFLEAGLLTPATVEDVHTPQTEMPDILLAQRWALGPMVKVWDGATAYGHSGTNAGGSSMLVWIPEKNMAFASISNVAPLGYPLAKELMAEILPSYGVTPPDMPAPADGVDVDADALTGSYVAHGAVHTIAADTEGLTLSTSGGPASARTVEPVRLLPLDGRRFLPGELRASGNRGWAVAFVGDEAGRATHFLNGVFLSRRGPA